MNILIIGGTGTIGKEIVRQSQKKHKVFIASKTTGDIKVDIENEASIISMYETLPPLDAVVVATGGQNGHFGPLNTTTVQDLKVGINSKLLGQVNVVLQGMKYASKKTSFTLIGGATDYQDIAPKLINTYMVNSALEGFVKAAALELPHSMRINLVAPSIISESLPEFESIFGGFDSVPASKIARTFIKSIEGAQTGQIYKL